MDEGYVVSIPKQVDRPEGHHGEDLDLPELDRWTAQDVIYHGSRRAVKI